MSDIGYQRHERENPVSSWVSRMFTLFIVGYVSVLLTYMVAITALYNPKGVPPSQQLTRLQVLETVLLVGLDASVPVLAKHLPPPSGIFLARLKSRVPIYSPIVFHSTVGILVFSVLGYIGGRMILSTSVLLLPLLLFFLTFGFLQSEIYRLIPLNLIPITVILASQAAACYAFALWGKWSSKG